MEIKPPILLSRRKDVDEINLKNLNNFKNYRKKFLIYKIILRLKINIKILLIMMKFNMN